MNSNVKTAVFWVVIICVAVLLYAVVHANKGKPDDQPSFTELMKSVDQGRVKSIVVNTTTGDVSGLYKDSDGRQFRSNIPTNYPAIYDKMSDKGVSISVQKDSGTGWVSILINAVPFVLLLAFWIFMMRQMQSGGNKALSFGKSRARLHSSQQKKVTFKDVAGVEEAKEELQEIIEFLREPQKFQKLGGRIPKGCAADRASRHRQDAAGARHRRRSQRAVLLHLRFGLCGDVCRRRRKPRPRPV